jgi:son of sevenless-like protein
LIRDDEKVNRSVMFRENEVPQPILPKGFTPYAKFQLLDWNSTELARQITLMEYEYFKKIEPKECLSGAWAKRNKYLLAPNIAGLTDRWNNMTNYLATLVMQEDDVKVRRVYITKFIEIGMELFKLNNLNGVTEIVAGLANVAVHRLKKTWEGIDQTSIQNLKFLQDLCNQQQANKNMRDALKKVYGPCVPPLSMYLKDLTFIEDGNPDILSDGLINVFKRRQIAQIIQRIKNYQQTPYPVEPVQYIRDNFHGVLFKGLMNDDEMWERSQKLEPREKK